MKEESDVVVPCFATKCLKDEDSGNGFPVCVETKRKKGKGEDNSAKEYDSVGFRKSVELDPTFLDSVNVKHGASAVDKAMHEAWLDDFFSRFAYTGGTESYALQCNTNGKNVEKCKLGSESKVKSSNGETGGWDKDRVVSPYFVKEAMADSIKQGLKKEIDSVRKVSPYFSISKQEDVHSGEVQTEGRNSKRKKLSPALTKADKRDTGEKGARDKDRVVSPYFVKEAMADSIKQGQKKGIGSVRKVSPYFSSSKQEDVHSGNLQTEGRKSKSKKLSPGLTKAEERDNGEKGARDKDRVVSPYFVKEAMADSIKQGQKKEIDSVRKVSPYFSSSKQDDVHSGKVQTEGQKSKGKKLSPVLTNAEKRDEAYRRITEDNTWKPPLLKLKLLQHDHASDPWRVLVICMLLNKTGGRQLKRLLPEFFKLCPNAKRATEIPAGDIENVIRTLGFQKKRSVAIQRMSKEYLEESWTHVTDLAGVGKYAADAYAIFCTGKWEHLKPCDKKLDTYWKLLCDHFFSSDP